MKDKQIQLIIIFSLVACGLHALLLNSPFSNYLYTSLFKVFIFILAPAVYLKVSKDGTLKDMLSLFSVKGNGRNMKIAFALGASTFLVVVAGFALLLPFMDRAVVIDALAANHITPGNIVFVFFYIVIINAALEQFFFRGFTFMWIYKKGNKRYAHAYSSLLFSFYHIPILFGAVSPAVLVFCTVGLIFAGLLFNEIAVRLKSIAASLVLHISANLAISLMVGLHFIF